MDSFVAPATLESRVTQIDGFERNELLLARGAVGDYVGSDNPVRFNDAFVAARPILFVHAAFRQSF
jgi:hypothetical protein